MTRSGITPDIAEQRYYELRQFLGGYLHQDWPEMHGSPAGAIDDAIGEYPVPNRRTVYAQLLAVLGAAEDDVDLRRILNRCFGVNVRFAKPREARAFADMVVEKLAASLRDQDRA